MATSLLRCFEMLLLYRQPHSMVVHSGISLSFWMCKALRKLWRCLLTMLKIYKDCTIAFKLLVLLSPLLSTRIKLEIGSFHRQQRIIESRCIWTNSNSWLKSASLPTTRAVSSKLMSTRSTSLRTAFLVPQGMYIRSTLVKERLTSCF